ncbi:MAG: pre-peptidase C-terminal domain-containing protein [Anaerolineae bacterium]|nr:pre-peptidase C-terminal domain-containing protein [Anaerolineae bacterium]
MKHTRIFILLIIVSLFSHLALAQDTTTFEGTLDDSTPSVTFPLKLQAGRLVVITTHAQNDTLDTVLRLYDSAGSLALENDDYTNGYESRLVYEPAASDTYTVEVSRYDDTSSGDFTLTVDAGVETLLGLSSDATVVLQSSGTLNNQTGEMKFSLALRADDILIVDTYAISGKLDTILSLLDQGGSLLVENDDRGDGSFDSEVVYRIPADGNYSLIVSRYSADSEGDFVIVAALDPALTPPFNFTAVEGDLIAEFSGYLDTTTESDEYPIELVAGQSLYAYTQATSGDLDTTLTLLDPSDMLVDLNDDRGDDTYNSAIVYTAPASGTYTIRVGRYRESDNSGDYDLRLLNIDAAIVSEIEALADQVLELSGPEQILETTNFRIHYTTDGSDAVTQEYLDAFADTLETIYDIQVNQMGWAQPPRNADGFYDAFLSDVIGTETDTLGYARPTRFVGDNPNTDGHEHAASRSALVVDNDFANPDMEGNPLSLMRATTTHEFNHIIQYGYDSEEPMNWLYEATATWIETATVGDEQDATGYVTDSYDYPETCFATQAYDGQHAYGDWTFMQSLADVHGESFIPQVWTTAIDYDGLDILEQALTMDSDSLVNAVTRWRVQNFARAYDLAPLFGATVWLENVINAPGSWTFTGSGIQELGANYFELDLKGSYNVELDGPDSLELWVLTVSDGEVNAYSLGQSGTFDMSGYDYVALMVTDHTTPADTSACTYMDYEINVSNADAGSPSILTPTYTFSATEFEPLQMQG